MLVKGLLRYTFERSIIRETCSRGIFSHEQIPHINFQKVEHPCKHTVREGGGGGTIIVPAAISARAWNKHIKSTHQSISREPERSISGLFIVFFQTRHENFKNDFFGLPHHLCERVARDTYCCDAPDLQLYVWVLVVYYEWQKLGTRTAHACEIPYMFFKRIVSPINRSNFWKALTPNIINLKGRYSSRKKVENCFVGTVENHLKRTLKIAQYSFLFFAFIDEKSIFHTFI